MALEVQNTPQVEYRPRPPWHVRLIMFIARTLLFTLLFAGLGMGVGLLFGIIATTVTAAAHHVQPDMTNAYRHIAIPVALVSGTCAFVWNVFRAVKDAVSART